MKNYLTLFVLLLSTVLGVAQSQKEMRVGLALSGGGAKGMAHVGVLRVLEENNIKIDYISGTSMGAVVGSMYALGYTVDEIEYYLKHVNWTALLENDLPKNRLSVLDRETNDRYLLNFEVNDSTIMVPDAFNQGQYMLKELSFLTWPAHGNNDFSKFKIPFLCIATNLETGAEAVLEKGNLAEALRASAAFPSVFSPYEIDGVLYADGGVRNNLPIEILKEQKGMDYVIAVDVQGRLYEKDELNSFLRILDQVGSFNNALYYEEQKKMADAIVRPKGIENYTIADYQHIDLLMKLGEDAALTFLDDWKDLPRKAPRQKVGKSLKQKSEIYISKVNVVGAETVTDRFIRSKLGFKKPNYITPEDLEIGIDKLYGTQNFDGIYFWLTPVDTAYELNVRVDEKKSNTNLKFGLHYDDDFGLGVLANITMRNQLLSNSKFTIDVVLSENFRGNVTYVYDRGFIPAVGFQFAFHRFGTALYQQGEAVTSLTYQDFSVNTFLASTIFDNYTIGGGVKFENIGYLEDFNALGITATNNNYIHYYGYLDFNSFNRSYKPTKGFELKGGVNTISSQVTGLQFATPSSVAFGQYKKAIKFNPKWGMTLRAVAAVTIGPDLNLPYKVYFGGLGENYNNFIFPFLGYRYMELFGRNAAMLRLDVHYEPAENHFVTLKSNIGKMEPTIDNLFSSDILLDGYGLSYGYNSALGPLEFTVMASSNRKNILTYLSLGFWF